MLLTITTTYEPATDLGFLLHKNPARCHSFDLPFGQAHVFYPEATAARATAALVLDVDPVGLARNRSGPPGTRFSLGQYVNDRPYVASSLLSVAIGRVFGSALGGRCKDRPDLADRPIPLAARLAVVPCRGGLPLLRRLFEPLGYDVGGVAVPLDPRFPEWGDSPYLTVDLTRVCPLHELLTHLYVLVPVLDNDKHYWVGDDEVEKLLRHGESWLAGHPDKDLIVRRYLKHRTSLARAALERLTEDEAPVESPEVLGAEETAVEEQLPPRRPDGSTPPPLNEQRLLAVLGVLTGAGAATVVDLGCGEGKLLRLLADDRRFTRVLGMDVSIQTLQRAARRLNLDQPAGRDAERVRLVQGSLMYRDARLDGFDAATVVEVIEHLDPPRLAAFGRVVFGYARPGLVIITTPNVEYNVSWPSLPAGRFRHRDHRFEWTRDEFQTWARSIATTHRYDVTFEPIGPVDAAVGPPTQMGVFRKQP